ncbi:hypothetical protein GCM10018793_20050 [Streptomyces sulfonofaciens]|uniref:PH domain-containing protein n=1 Tax=Streptomyces sulfonofaciens TaxID=68272 RepID=A0A919KY06_9ACTN|nr:hypothetical protein [Streptomyces sulfonofaciens]GHH75746.1 hypothetical protein GCM10018793_20050 [Streptomyces sulfonofaciens]
MIAHSPLRSLGGPVAGLVTAAGQTSANVTDWPARASWLVGILLLVALVCWLMREGWRWRATLQSGLPALRALPADPGTPRLTMTGLYHGSTAAGQWLERLVAHGLGARSRAELTLYDCGLHVRRPGSTDFFVPADDLRAARLDNAIAGKVLTRDGLLVVTWAHGDQLIDSGFRSDHAAEHPAWTAALTTPNQHTPKEGAIR